MKIRISRPAKLLPALFFALLIALFSFEPGFSSQAGTPQDGPAQWFAKPYELPKDVFDLAFFNPFRQGGVLNAAQAGKALEALSDSNLPAAQALFDSFAWKAFVALNWAARADGSPDPSKGFGDNDTPKVWEYWKQSGDIFLANGAKPAPWGGLYSKSADHFKAGWKHTTTADQGKQAFSGPLIDQNGKWLHYMALVNRTEFRYIDQYELYNLEGQAAFVKDNMISFPVDTAGEYGAIEIKLAWKALTDAEIASNRFLVRRLPVVLYTPPAAMTAAAAPAQLSGVTADNNPGQSSIVEQTVGLAGMHIAMRTRSSPQWIWATFEQIDNTRLDLNSGDGAHPLPAKPSLSNPDDPEALVSANLLPPTNAVGPDGKPIGDWDERKAMKPVEVLRLVPPPLGTEKINRLAQSFLASKGSVLRYYELNGTQWPKHPKAPAIPGGQGSAPESIMRKMPGDVVPVYLVNATMETYFQKGFQDAGPLEQDDRVPFSIDTTKVFGTESCVGCHYSAGACIGFRTAADGTRTPIFGQNGQGGFSANANFSWLLQIEAKSKGTK